MNMNTTWRQSAFGQKFQSLDGLTCTLIFVSVIIIRSRTIFLFDYQKTTYEVRPKKNVRSTTKKQRMKYDQKTTYEVQPKNNVPSTTKKQRMKYDQKNNRHRI